MIEPLKIYKQITAVMNDLEAITKSRQAHTYKFRGIDDVYNAMHPLLAKHGVFTVPEVIEERTEEKSTKNGGVSIYRILKIKYHFFAEDGSSVVATVIGEGMDSGDKASNKAMAVAHKYALMQVFAIPTEDAKDPENDHHELTSTQRMTQGNIRTQGMPSAKSIVETRTGRPHDPSTYQATPDQKLELFSLVKRFPDVKPPEMKGISDALMGVPMGELSVRLKEIIEAGA